METYLKHIKIRNRNKNLQNGSWCTFSNGQKQPSKQKFKYNTIANKSENLQNLKVKKVSRVYQLK